MADIARTLITPQILKALLASRSVVVRSQLNEESRTTSAAITIHVGEDKDPGYHTVGFNTYATAYSFFGFGLGGYSWGNLIQVIFHYPSQVTVLGTVFALLKVGDEVGIEWALGNGNGSQDEAGLTTDHLFLNVRRTSKAGKIQDLKFELDRVCTDRNSSARMLRHA